MSIAVIGWTDTYGSSYRQEKFTDERKRALIERVKKRQYNFNYSDHCFLPFAAPFFNDGTYCALTKSEWDYVMDEAYKDILRPSRLMPQDAIIDAPIDGVLYEKRKFYEEMKAGEKHG